MAQPLLESFSLASFKKEHNQPEVLVVTGGVKNENSTSFAINFASYLSQNDKKALLLNVSENPSALETRLKINPLFTLSDFITKNIDISKIITQTPFGYHYMSTGLDAITVNELGKKALKKLNDSFVKYERNYDYLIINIDIKYSNSVSGFMLGANKVLLVASTNPNSISEIYGTVKVIRQSKADPKIYLIIEQNSSTDQPQQIYNKMNLMARKFLQCHIIFGGSFCMNKSVEDEYLGNNGSESPYSNHPGNIAFLNIFQKTLKDKSARQKHNGFFNRILLNETN